MTILFSDLCLLFDRLSSIKPKQPGGQPSTSKSPIEIFRHWLSALDKPTHYHGLLLFRLIFPQFDIRRRYGLKESLLARELPKALSFSTRSLDHWNKKISLDTSEYIDAKKSRAGCLGNTLEAILKTRRVNSASPSLPLELLDALLDELASHCEYSCTAIHSNASTKPRRTRKTILAALFEPLGAREASYLVQIILRDLSPLLYPLSTASLEKALMLYNSNAYQTLEINHAIAEWSWALPVIWRYRADLDAAFNVLQMFDIQSSTSD